MCKISRLRAMPAAILPAFSRFLSVYTIVSMGSVPFVRALILAIAPVLWNFYGASTILCPEPTSTAVNRLHAGTRYIVPYELLLKPLSLMTWWRFGGRIKSLTQAIGIRRGVARKSHVDDRGRYRCDMSSA